MSIFDYVVVGAGIAGVNAALTIRDNDPTATVLLINGEGCLPYKRTKLSKNLQIGYRAEDFTLLPFAHYYDKRIALVQDWIAAHQPEKKELHGRRQRRYRYQKLILATGSDYQIPAAWQSSRSLNLHSMADGLDLQQRARQAKTITILGAGVEGLELAAAFASSHQVTIIEISPDPINQIASTTIKNRLKQRLHSAGVTVHSNETIVTVTENSDKLVLECNNRTITTDLLLLATGTQPNAQLLPHQPGRPLAAADQYLRWNADIFIAGDLGCYNGRKCSLWHEAEYSGQTAGLNAARSRQQKKLLPYQQKIFRTKLECFSDYYFFAQPPDPASGTITEYHLPNRYYQLWFAEQRLIGGNMMSSGAKEQQLQQLIWENCCQDDAERALAICPP